MRNRRLLLILFFVFFAKPLLAHPLSPSLWEFLETSPGQVTMGWKAPAASVSGDDLSPQVPTDCQEIGTGGSSREGKFLIEHWKLHCEPTWITHPITMGGISTGRDNVILKIRLADGRTFQHILNVDAPSFLIPNRMGEGSVFKNYFPLGFHHILSGWDHLLFVLGLFLLIKPGKKLLWAITAFTLGHSLTLSLAVLEVVPIPSRVVEVLIALSILILAVELLRDQTVKATFFHRYSWVIAFSFGLLHGMGFAGALAEVGLPMGEIPLALFSFNVGIEAGQLCFIAGLWTLWKIMKALPLPTFWRRIEIPAYVIGSLSAFWFFERLSMVFSR
jgi:hydrogenase/urease accessory protein HupE